jgi:predicted RNA polymerase sigma factor
MKLLKGTQRPTDLQRVITSRQRRTCTLAWSTDMPHDQIAQSQGVSLKAISMRLYRARRRLRKAGIEPPNRTGPSMRAPAFQLNSVENV